jgi:curli biogenesis system outer membrane secretion channel CsgG
MKRFLEFGVLIALAVLFLSCAPTAEVTSGAGGPSIGQAQAEYYNGPKARIAVARFDIKAAKAPYEIGEGLSEMLTTELFNTNRYIVLERQQLEDILKEQDLGASGRVKPETAAPIGQVEGAELLVYGAVTAFEPNYRGGGGGLVIPGLNVGLGGGAKQAYMAIDVRVVDTRTSRILAATTVEGKSTDYGAIFGAVIGGGTTRMPIGLGGWKNTPMEKAIRVCIKRAVDFIVSRTPAQYFHYNAQGLPVNAPQQGGGSHSGGGGLPSPQQQQPQQKQPSNMVPSSQNSQATNDLVVVKAFKANIRKASSTNSPVVTTAKRGEKLVILREKGDWYQVQTESGVMGWIYKYLTRSSR